MESAGIDALPVYELAFPGPLRDALVTAVLAGTKSSTTGLVLDYEVAGEPLPRAGARSALLDSDGHRVAIIEITEVRVVRLAEVDLPHAMDEGEGHTTVAAWRADHEAYWHGPDMRAVLGDPDFTVHDDTMVVLERLRVVARA